MCCFRGFLSPIFEVMDETKRALENPLEFTKAHSSVVSLDNDLSNSDLEIYMADMNITANSAKRTSDKKLLQEFTQGHIINTFGIGIYCSTGSWCTSVLETST